MKKKFTLWHAISLALAVTGLVFLTLCIATDINYKLFLPLALGFTLLANVISIVMQVRANKKCGQPAQGDGTKV